MTDAQYRQYQKVRRAELRKRLATLVAIAKYPKSLRGAGIGDQIAECRDALAQLGVAS